MSTSEIFDVSMPHQVARIPLVARSLKIDASTISRRIARLEVGRLGLGEPGPVLAAGEPFDERVRSTATAAFLAAGNLRTLLLQPANDAPVGNVAPAEAV